MRCPPEDPNHPFFTTDRGAQHGGVARVGDQKGTGSPPGFGHATVSLACQEGGKMRMDQMRRAWNDLPLAGLDEVLNGRVPLILAPHPDDETLGCGGLIARACAAKIPLHIAVLTDGSHAHPQASGHPPESLRRLREQETKDALLLLGLPHGRTWFLGLADAGLPCAGPNFERAARRIAGICENHGCNLLITTWRHDPHPDHTAAATLAEHVAAREGIPLLSYPIWGWILPGDANVDEPAPRGWRLDISEQVELKAKAVAAHATQYGKLVHEDPTGNLRPEGLLGVFQRPFETFISS
jgi:LmbE family N-acetylglucosaminyl deacetylase